MLTDADCRNAKCPDPARPRPEGGKIEPERERYADGWGLYLEVARGGAKRWFLKYRFGGKERRLAIGSYPAVTLKAAREARDAARDLLRAGADPVLKRKAERLTKAAVSAVTFEAVAREFHNTKRDGWSDAHGKQWLRACEKDLFPWIGEIPLADVSAQILREVLRKVERRGARYMARDLCEFAGQVFRHGCATGRCSGNPAAALRGALEPHLARHMAAVVEPDKIGALMRDIHAYAGQPVTRAALLLSALTFQRPGNIRAMRWADVDLEQATWTIPAAQMKRRKADKINGRPHIVPLAPQAIAALAELRPLTQHAIYVFPSMLSAQRCMSENTIRAALRRLGYGNAEMSAHGFRAMARTTIAEQFAGVDPQVVEAQLAHGKAGPLGMAYDRSEYLEQRRALMVRWADYLDALRDGAAALRRWRAEPSAT